MKFLKKKHEYGLLTFFADFQWILNDYKNIYRKEIDDLRGLILYLKTVLESWISRQKSYYSCFSSFSVFLELWKFRETQQNCREKIKWPRKSPGSTAIIVTYKRKILNISSQVLEAVQTGSNPDPDSAAILVRKIKNKVMISIFSFHFCLLDPMTHYVCVGWLVHNNYLKWREAALAYAPMLQFYNVQF